jgi:hypothetical protein
MVLSTATGSSQRGQRLFSERRGLFSLAFFLGFPRPALICTNVQMKWSCQQKVPERVNRPKSIFFKGDSPTVPPMLAR